MRSIPVGGGLVAVLVVRGLWQQAGGGWLVTPISGTDIPVRLREVSSGVTVAVPRVAGAVLSCSPL